MGPVEPGDRIRVLQSDWMGARVEEGDVLIVTRRVTEGIFATNSPRNDAALGWWFGDHHEGTGWERVE